MTAEQFRAALARLGLSQSGFARLLREFGDRAQFSTVQRRVQRWAAADAKVPGEAAAFLMLYERWYGHADSGAG